MWQQILSRVCNSLKVGLRGQRSRRYGATATFLYKFSNGYRYKAIKLFTQHGYAKYNTYIIIVITRESVANRQEINRLEIMHECATNERYALQGLMTA